ncbi:MAG: integral rane protein [Pseudarthrobacter sp.]|nr:integral rane protein [Pseudarthrobacter sp.]
MAAEPPVLPDAQEARRWAAEELAKPEYVSAEPGWLEEQWRRFLDWLASLDGPSTADGGLAAPLIGVAIAVLVAAAIIVARPRLNAGTKSVQEVFDGDTSVSASDYRSSAAAAAGRGDWGTAVVQCFRALVRAAEDRDVVDARPGRTADEAARELAGVFVPEAWRLGWAAETFDRIRYGHGTADPADYAAMVDLDAALQSLKPGGTPVSAGGAP